MIYLDYQATTPLAPEAREAMLPWLGGPGESGYGNPHAPYRLGREAAAAVGHADAQVRVALGAESGRLVFTSGATEAVSWAIQSAMRASGRRAIVTIATEHACVLDTVSALGRDGFETRTLPVGPDGLVDPSDARAVIDREVGLVVAMLVNNEIGVIQPIGELADLAHARGALLLCDAVQGFGRATLPIARCDLVALSAHKIYGPKGIGALWLRDGLDLPPLIFGGGQQGGLRSGTLSPALCAGFGAAAALMHERRAADDAHVFDLFGFAHTMLGGWAVNGALDRRYFGNLNLRREGIDAARLISEVRDVAFSAGSACASGSGQSSHVLRALGLSDAQARGSIRLGFGRYTTFGEMERAMDLILKAAARQLEWA